MSGTDCARATPRQTEEDNERVDVCDGEIPKVSALCGGSVCIWAGKLKRAGLDAGRRFGQFKINRLFFFFADVQYLYVI